MKGEWDGKVCSLSDYVAGDRFVLVDFWASWCGPCRFSVPQIIALSEKYRDRGLVVLGIAVSDKMEDTGKAVEELGINYDVFSATDNAFMDEFGLNAIPHLTLIGPDGTILANGFTSMETEDIIRKVLPYE